MDIAAMNIRITFQKSEVVSDQVGNRKNVWTDYHSCFATISDSVGRSSVENGAAGMTTEHAEVGFTVRFCKKTMAVDTTGFRILWNGGVYNIRKVDHLNLKKHALKFRCEKERQ